VKIFLKGVEQMKVRFSSLLESPRKLRVWASLVCVCAVLLAVPFAAQQGD